MGCSAMPGHSGQPCRWPARRSPANAQTGGIATMAWLVDDIAEAALGPWAIAVGTGVGLVILARRGRGGRARTATLVAPVVAMTNWWRDVYADAHAEWTAERATGRG